jgi:hypothetical protein
MKAFLPLLLCLSLSIFTVARATKPTQTAALNIRSAEKNTTEQEADAKPLLDDKDNDEDMASDDNDSITGAFDNEGENVTDENAGDAPDDQDTGDDNEGADDGGADGGGDEGE